GVASSVPAGDVVVPAHLRYQACNETTCFPPKTVDASFSLHVVPAGAPVKPLHGEVLDRIAFGRGETPVVGETSGASKGGAGSDRTPPSGDELASLDQFAVLGTTGGYLGSKDFREFIHNAETGVKPHGWLE